MTVRHRIAGPQLVMLPITLPYTTASGHLGSYYKLRKADLLGLYSRSLLHC